MLLPGETAAAAESMFCVIVRSVWSEDSPSPTPTHGGVAYLQLTSRVQSFGVGGAGPIAPPDVAGADGEE